jgi:hypothetical protein
MTIINMPIPKLKIYANVSSEVVSCVFSNVNFLHFGKFKMRFLHIAPVVYRWYIINNYDCLGVSIHAATEIKTKPAFSQGD